MSQWSGHGTRKTILPGHPDRQPDRGSGSARAARRGARRGSGRMRSRAAAERVIGARPPRRPWRRRRPGSGSRGRRRSGRRVARSAAMEPRSRSGAEARRADPGDRRRRPPASAVRTTASVYRASSSTPSWYTSPPRRPSVPEGRGELEGAPPSTGAGASRRHGAHPGCRTASGRRRRTPSRRTGSRRSGTAAARAGRGAARGRSSRRPLGERLADEPEPELLEVAQAAVDQPRRARRRARRRCRPAR